MSEKGLPEPLAREADYMDAAADRFLDVESRKSEDGETVEAYTPPDGLDLSELDGWDQLSVWDAFLSLGGSHSTCSTRMAGEVRNADAWCAALKDSALGTDLWRKGSAAHAGEHIIEAADPTAVEYSGSISDLAEIVRETLSSNGYEDVDTLQSEDDYVALSIGGVDPTDDDPSGEFQPVVIVDSGDGTYQVQSSPGDALDGLGERVEAGGAVADEDLPEVPDADDERTRNLWKELINRAVMKGEDRIEASAWDPALHPRGPDGQFVERPYSVPEEVRGMDTESIVQELADSDPDFTEKVEDIQIDGIEDIQEAADTGSGGNFDPMPDDLDVDVANPDELRELWQNGWDQTADDRGILDESDITPEEFAERVAEDEREMGWDDTVGSAGRVIEKLRSENAESTEPLDDVDVDLSKYDDSQSESIKSALQEAGEKGLLENVEEFTGSAAADPGDAAGSFDPGRGTLWIDSRYTDENTTMMRSSGRWASGNLTDLVTHEAVHAAHYDSAENAEKLSNKDLTQSEIGVLEEEVSDYAATNPLEAVAEIGVMKMRGDDVPNQVEEIYQKYEGPAL